MNDKDKLWDDGESVMVTVSGGFLLCTVLEAGIDTMTVRSKHEESQASFEVTTKGKIRPTNESYEPSGCDFYDPS